MPVVRGADIPIGAFEKACGSQSPSSQRTCALPFGYNGDHAEPALHAGKGDASIFPPDSFRYEWRNGAGPARPTLEMFIAAYPPPTDEQWESAKKTHDVYLVSFMLRTRVPNASGMFGPDAVGATWCNPEDWHRLYHAVLHP